MMLNVFGLTEYTLQTFTPIMPGRASIGVYFDQDHYVKNAGEKKYQ